MFTWKGVLLAALDYRPTSVKGEAVVGFCFVLKDISVHLCCLFLPFIPLKDTTRSIINRHALYEGEKTAAATTKNAGPRARLTIDHLLRVELDAGVRGVRGPMIHQRRKERTVNKQ